jgi:hypothetical protein
MLTLVLTLVGVAFGAIGAVPSVDWYRRRRYARKAELQLPSSAQGELRALRRASRRRRRSFREPLVCMTQYLRVLKEKAVHTRVPKSVVSDWAFDVLLTSAANISRFSQGKANLFQINENSLLRGVATLRSREFVGPFSLWQLTDGRGNYRDMEVHYDSGQPYSDAVPVAGLTLLTCRIQLVDLRRVGFPSELERALGTTHILGIPLGTRQPNETDSDVCQGLAALPVGLPVVITVDLRFPHLLLASFWYWRYRQLLLARAEDVQRIGAELVQAMGVMGE